MRWFLVGIVNVGTSCVVVQLANWLTRARPHHLTESTNMRTVFVAIGKFSVRFRWLVAIGWILITIVSVRAFPGLSTISQSSNSAFLPTNSPSEKASKLAAPFQNSAFISMTLVVARDGGRQTVGVRCAQCT